MSRLVSLPLKLKPLPIQLFSVHMALLNAFDLYLQSFLL